MPVLKVLNNKKITKYCVNKIEMLVNQIDIWKPKFVFMFSLDGKNEHM